MEQNTELKKRTFQSIVQSKLKYILASSFFRFFTILFLLVMLLHFFVARQVQVSGESMETTLSQGNLLFLEKVTYYFHEPERYDLIVFQSAKEGKKIEYIKRVIGLPGETIQIKKGKVYINGKKLKENYGAEKMEDAGKAAAPITLEENEYFVLGDNRNASKDSRHPEVDIVNKRDIEGRAFLRVWPITKFGILKHQ